MYNQNYLKRRKISYKIKMWFYNLTIKKVAVYMKVCFLNVIEFIVIGLSFILIFIIPHLFHQTKELLIVYKNNSTGY